MAKKRAPGGILVKGVSVFVKDPNAAVGDLFLNYVRVPGLGAITLPDESAPSTDIVVLDGTTAATGTAPVGTISCPVGVLSEHPAHQFLGAARRSGALVQVAVIRPAENRIDFAVAADAVAAAANGKSEVVVVGDERAKAKLMLEGDIVSFAAAAAAAPMSNTFLYYYNAAPAAAALDDSFQAVMEIEDDGSVFNITPGMSGNADSVAAKVFLRTAGKKWKDIECQVGQMSDGDFQSSTKVSGNLVFNPTSVLPEAVTVADNDPEQVL